MCDETPPVFPAPGNLTDEEYIRKLHNSTLEEFFASVYSYVYPTSAREILYIILCVIIFVTGLTGNFLVCYAVWKNRSLRNATNYFLVNLAVGDFLVILICLPATILHDVTTTWFLGDATCKLFLYLQDTSVVVSVLTLTAIAIERWLAICHPMKFRPKTSRTRIIIASIWIVAFLSTTPDFFIARVVYNRDIPRHISKLLAACMSCPEYDLIYRMMIMILYFLVPVVIMAVAYTSIAKCLWSSADGGVQLTGCDSSALAYQLQQRRRTAKMLIMVVIVFVVCYLPVHLMILLGLLKKLPKDQSVLDVLYLTSHALIYINSTTNPIIYNFMSTKFREEFGRVCVCCKILQSKKPHTEYATVETTGGHHIRGIRDHSPASRMTDTSCADDRV